MKITLFQFLIIKLICEESGDDSLKDLVFDEGKMLYSISATQQLTLIRSYGAKPVSIV